MKTIHLFTYGTLMHPLIWAELITNTYDSRPFAISHFSRRALKDRIYPGIIPSIDKCVKGVLYLNISENDIRKLDHFEGGEYKRISVINRFENSDIPVHTYEYIGPRENIEDEDWNYENFIETKFQEFKNNFKGWDK